MIEIKGFVVKTDNIEEVQNSTLRATLETFKDLIVKPEVCEFLRGDLVPSEILGDEKNDFLLIASDCVVGKYNRYYGHYMRVSFNEPDVVIRTNYTPEEIIVRSPADANNLIPTLVGKYPEQNWKDLRPLYF